MEFNWKNYIEIDASLSEYNSHLTKALDTISVTPEGQALIKGALPAYQNSIKTFGYENESMKIRIGATNERFNKVINNPKLSAKARNDISTTVNNMGSAAYADDGTIVLKFDQLERARYNNESGNSIPLSLTNTLVHELYHLNDPQLDIIKDNASFMSSLIMVARGLVGGIKHEERAVAYTDSFMGKYFNEPPRNSYGNAALTRLIDDIRVPDLKCGEKFPVYKAEQGQPEILTVTCPDVLKDKAIIQK